MRLCVFVDRYIIRLFYKHIHMLMFEMAAKICLLIYLWGNDPFWHDVNFYLYIMFHFNDWIVQIYGRVWAIKCFTLGGKQHDYQNDQRIILIFTMDLIPIVGYYFDNVIGPYLFHFSRSRPICCFLFFYMLLFTEEMVQDPVN